MDLDSMLPKQELELERAAHRKSFQYEEDSPESVNTEEERSSSNFVEWAKVKIGKIDSAVLHNSTSSIKLDSHIGRPDFNKIILCVSMVLHCQVMEGSNTHSRGNHLHRLFDEDYIREKIDSNGFILDSSSMLDEDMSKLESRSSHSEMRSSSNVESQDNCVGTIFKRSRRQSLDYPMPTIEDIIKLFASLFERSNISAECGIVSLIYLNRLINDSGIKISPANFRPLILTSVFIAQKVWQDKHYRSSSFAKKNNLSRKALQCLESKYYDLIEFDIYINRSTYSKYYYELRALGYEKCDMQIQELSPFQAHRLEIRSSRFGMPQKVNEEGEKKSRCLEDLDFAKPKSRYVIS